MPLFASITSNTALEIPRADFCISRVRDLLKSGVLKEKPIWYDVVAAFPPFVQADLDRKPERGSVKRIVFPEDLHDGYV